MTEHHLQEDTHSRQPSLPPLELGNLSINPSSPITAEPIRPQEAAQEAQRERVNGNAPNAEEDTETAALPKITTADAEEATDAAPGPLPASVETSTTTRGRQNSEAIGPDLPTSLIQNFPQGPHIQFVLLLASAGTRHPFQLNERYLTKRNVNAMDINGNFDPSMISVYNLKELIFKDWRDDWDNKPSSPSAIRLIFFGQLLADNTSLKECKIQSDGAANVLHISIKPQEVMDDEEAGKTGKSSISRGHERGSSSTGCRCVIL